MDGTEQIPAACMPLQRLGVVCCCCCCCGGCGIKDSQKTQAEIGIKDRYFCGDSRRRTMVGDGDDDDDDDDEDDDDDVDDVDDDDDDVDDVDDYDDDVVVVVVVGGA